MDPIVKVAELDNEIEAQLVDGVLTDRHVPHIIRSYHLLRSDGSLQGLAAWGQIDAPQSVREDVKRVVDEVRRQAAPSRRGDGGDDLA